MSLQAPEPAAAPALAAIESAFDELVEPYVQRLYRFLVVRLRDESEARDALQETLLAAWLGLPQLRDRDRPWAWLVGIAAHKAADSTRRRRHGVPLDAAPPIPAEGRASDTRAALARLPRKAREVLLLRYLARLSEEETAAVLGIRVGTVKSRAARARKLLLEELA
ncbi:MAG TPA: sigma factor-like helix-turn-helix DNA-binding protein [Gaiellaceae bacterium]